MDSKLIKILESQNWEEIIKKLYAHSIFRINWFGLKSEVKMQGKESKDFANEAVTLLWEGKRNWDYTKETDVLKFLKGVVNSLIYNMIKSKEREVYKEVDLSEEMSDSLFSDKMFEERIIGEDFIDKLEDTMLQDGEMWLVFKSVLEGLKPIDIEEKYGMKIEVIRNIQKKLRRHTKNITKLKSNP